MVGSWPTKCATSAMQKRWHKRVSAHTPGSYRWFCLVCVVEYVEWLNVDTDINVNINIGYYFHNRCCMSNLFWYIEMHLWGRIDLVMIWPNLKFIGHVHTSPRTTPVLLVFIKTKRMFDTQTEFISIQFMHCAMLSLSFSRHSMWWHCVHIICAMQPMHAMFTCVYCSTVSNLIFISILIWHFSFSSLFLLHFYFYNFCNSVP